MNILLVEDSQTDAALVQRYLRDGNDPHVVRVVRRFADFAAAACENAWDIVLLDMTLPDGEGLELYRRAREIAPTLPIVILSARSDEELALAAVAAGAQDYLLKGHVDDVTLKRALRYAVERDRMQRRLENGLAELERQRANVIRLNAQKNELIATLAHDIRGPLTAIVGFGEMLADGGLEGEEATKAAETIVRNGQRLATLSDDVVALARIELGELELDIERFDIAALVTEEVEGRLAQRSIRWVVDAEDTTIVGDKRRLRQSIDNLLGNAVKYSQDDTPIVVTLHGNVNSLTLDVSDQGIGIPNDELARVFDRFARGSNARRAKIAGTGLGLFLVRTFIERHGGRISVRSAVGVGSTFSVVLPRNGAGLSVRGVVVLANDRNVREGAAYELRARGIRVRELASADELAMLDPVAAPFAIFVERRILDEERLRALVPESMRGAPLIDIPPHFLGDELVDALRAGTSGATRVDPE
uniref:histidine kinase n=1 Tax=mine drainage metagenome TaxID=410659 RepID=E6PI81_9ZZZZ